MDSPTPYDTLDSLDVRGINESNVGIYLVRALMELAVRSFAGHNTRWLRCLLVLKATRAQFERIADVFGVDAQHRDAFAAGEVKLQIHAPAFEHGTAAGPPYKVWLCFEVSDERKGD